MSELTPQNVHNFCRTCLKKPKQKFSIWENDIYELLAAIYTYHKIEADDKFPQFVCSKCHKKLQAFIEFRVESLKSHSILANIVAEAGMVENQIGTESQQGGSLENCEQKVENDLTQSPIKELKSDYETIFCADVEPKVEDEFNAGDVLTYAAAYSPNSTDNKEALDNLAIDNELPNTQKNDEKLENLSISIHKSNLQKKSDYSDESDPTEPDEIPEKVANKRSRSSKSKKLLAANNNTPAQHRETKKKKKSVGGGGPQFHCDQCPRRFVTKENYEAHMRTHQGLKPWLCKECGRCFSRGDHLREHVREIHMANKQYKCTFEGCDQVFRREATYRHHYRLKHKASCASRERKNYVCEDCGKTYNNATTFKEHRFKHLPIEEYPFSCDECGKKFRSKRRVQEHQLRHTGIKNFVCPYCGMKKATKNELRTHINYHTKERQWPCPNCTSVFNSKANLSMHDRVVHQGIRRFACKYCELSFGKPDTLKHHEMRHTGERPHGCEICGKRFIQSVALRAHLKVHNKGSAIGTSKILSVAETSLLST